MQRQLQHAGEIQRRMMPARLPASTVYEFGAVYDPTLAVGGDFYDLVELPKGHIGICIADVMGKGIPAALMMASIRSALRAQADQVYDLDRMIGRVNRLLCRDTLPGEFATLFYGVLAPDRSRLTYCNAGHDPPLLLRGDDFIELTTGGMVLGVMSDTAYERGLVELRLGDIIVLATDGVTTALNFEDRAYGRERLRDSIQRHRQLAAQQLASQLLWDVRRFVGLADQADDTTLVVVKVRLSALSKHIAAAPEEGLPGWPRSFGPGDGRYIEWLRSFRPYASRGYRPPPVAAGRAGTAHLERAVE